MMCIDPLTWWSATAWILGLAIVVILMMEGIIGLTSGYRARRELARLMMGRRQAG